MKSIPFQIDRRTFLASVGAAALAGCGPAGPTVSLLAEPDDPVATSAPVSWALAELKQAIESKGGGAVLRAKLADVPAGELCVAAAGAASQIARGILEPLQTSAPDAPESLVLAQGKLEDRNVVLAGGFDPRGAVYALLELADRVRHTAKVTEALGVPEPVRQQPHNPTRSITRLFCSDIEDKPWYNDREMWPQYLSMLAAQRFNRFNLALGIGYDFLREVTDGYFLFAYPFLLDVPGYSVRVSNLPDSERDSNLEMLRYISEETVKRGLEFQLGIWTHGYEWVNSPNPNHVIEGLSAENHGAYCRDALTALLKACPAISGVTLRIHGESGVAEGSYDFWKTVFDGVVQSGRKVEIDMHAKGIDFQMIDNAVATGLPVKTAPKYWAEHLGMPYHQAAIRELEMPRERPDGDFFALSGGSRRFLRYGIGDLMREDRRYQVMHRIWPGTQRLLIWGDPQTAAAYSHAFRFCGGNGVEIMEPLSFKGRRGSGIAGDRCAYKDKSLSPKWDWQKYLYTYRVWGRHLYDPNCDPAVYRRYLDNEFGAAGAAMEGALASASRILPIITTAHGASAGNNTYWPEVYTNQPIVDPTRKHPYGDTPAPKVFGNVSPLDPEMFSSINDHAREIVEGRASGKYSPVEVATWLEGLANNSADKLDEAKTRVADAKRPEFRRAAIDTEVQIETGRFFAAKMRSGVLYGIYEQTSDRAALEKALEKYREAHASWQKLIDLTKDVYISDITVGERHHLRGHWSDRMPEIEGDIADMEAKLNAAGETSNGRAAKAIEAALASVRRAASPLTHQPPETVAAGKALKIEAAANGAALKSVTLHYRHVNQAERYQSAAMRQTASGFAAEIPARYTDSVYPLEYYFVVRPQAAPPVIHPGIGDELASQPYHVVRRA